MKSSLFIAVLLCIAMSAAAQNIKSSETGLHRRIHYGADAKFICPQETPSPATKNPRTLPKSPATTHTITFHFNPPTMGGMLDLVSEDTVYFAFANGNTVMEMEEGYYDLIFEYSAGAYGPEVLILDRFHVYQDMDTTLSLSSAVHGIKLNMEDENGVPLNPYTWSGGNGIGLLVALTPGMKFPDWSLTGSGTNVDSIRITDIPSTMSFRAGREVLVHKDHYQRYVANFPFIDTLWGDTTFTCRQEDLQKFPFVFYSTPAGKDYYLSWGWGIVDNPMITGAVDTFVGAFLDNSCPSAKTDTVILYLNHGVNDSAIAFFATFINYEQYDYTQTYMLGGLLSPTSFLDVDDDLILTMQGNYPPAKNDYKVAPGENILVGTSPPYNVTWSYSDPQSNFIRVSTHHRGPANERRYIDASIGMYEVWKDGQMLMTDTLRNFHFNLGFPQSGEYQFIVNDSNYLVCGMQGFHQTILDFDLSDPVDPNSPSPLAFMILQGDSLAQEILNGFEASVVFTAADFLILPGDPVHYYQSIEQADLYYKEHFSNDWQLLDLIPLTDELDSLAGMPYYADLAPVMTAISDSAWIDLRMELTDPAGNINIQTFSPAFLLRDIMVGEKEITENDLKIFPNPVDGNLNFSQEVTSAVIYSAEGKVVSKSVNVKSIDMSGIPAGTYLIRAVLKDGQRVNRKIIKI